MRRQTFFHLALVVVPALLPAADFDILPTPQYAERLGANVHFPTNTPIPVRKMPPQLNAAQQALSQGFPAAQFVTGESDAGVVLWNYAASKEVTIQLNFLDRFLLSESPLRAQSYVLRTEGKAVWVIGGGPAGVLYGAATLAQLMRKTKMGVVDIPGTYIRDYPDFEYRAASDWLLNTEVNRWALDRGKGLDDYGRLVRKKIDRAARYKINVAVIDGFGWSLEKRPPGYALLMRDLNHYARERGISLQFGGYGAAYDIAQREGEYGGEVFLNRESYPNGKVYQCLAFPERKGGIDPRTMGSCRSNEELNHLKAENLAQFVDAVEPGVLYIHHEDCCIFEDFQKAWLGRCERCRRKWPNDSLVAPDGGAGALAHGYSALIERVNKVEHAATEYKAARDTQITLVSPVYVPATSRSDDWGQVMELWRTIAKLLPRASNVQICFREVLPQPGGGQSWVELFNSTMKAEKLPFGAYVFVVGGADNFLTDYPTSGIPAMNGYFRGARTVYNSTGDFYREPMEILSAEYSWNTHSTGFSRIPAKEADMAGIEKWIYTPASPPELFGPKAIFDRICRHLYGNAAPAMADYYRLAKLIPDVETPPPAPDRPYYQGRKSTYLPHVWKYATAVPSYWNHLLTDSSTWGTDQDDDYLRAFKGFDIPVTEVHRRLSHRWSLAAQLNTEGAAKIRDALAAGPDPESLEDLQFLKTLFETYQPFVEALRDYHNVRSQPSAPSSANQIRSVLQNARKTQALVAAHFPNPVDPVAGEIQSLHKYPARLIAAAEAWERSK